MPNAMLTIIIHQLLFQGMFIIKNLYLRVKIDAPIRGTNREATISIVFFALFIVISLGLSSSIMPPGTVLLLENRTATLLALGLISLNLVVSALSLAHLGESWRVGVLENQRTELITNGIYNFSRNPYFLSYLLIFAAYTLLLQNVLLLGLSIIGFVIVHRMILKEENYLTSTHGEDYLEYMTKVPRYIF